MKKQLLAAALLLLASVAPMGADSSRASESPRATSSGDIFEPYTEYTAASPYLPFGTDLLVTYGDYSVVVEVTDRGPYVAGRDIDLSAAAAEEIGLTYVGTDYVDVEVLN